MILTRYGSLPDIGTFGKIPTPLGTFATVEQHWNDNQPFKSCVPMGDYTLVPFDSDKFGKVYALVGETVSKYKSDKQRYACLMHQANWPRDVQGCIGVGENLTHINGLLGVTNSRFSLQDLFRYMLEADDFELTIVNDNPGG